jgi:hypothetical protein
MGARAKFDDRKLRGRVKDANFQSLGHAAAVIRKAARRSIHKRKKPATPGQPPHTQTRNLPHAVLYAVTRDREFAVVGPSSHFGRRIHKVAALHEFSGYDGTYRNRRRRIRRVGGAGEIEIVRRRRRNSTARVVTLKKTLRGNVRVRFAKIRTAAQARRANQINEQLYGPLKARANYPKRPFMGPALKRVAPQLPEHWRGTMLH